MEKYLESRCILLKIFVYIYAYEKITYGIPPFSLSIFIKNSFYPHYKPQYRFFSYPLQKLLWDLRVHGSSTAPAAIWSKYFSNSVLSTPNSFSVSGRSKELIKLRIICVNESISSSYVLPFKPSILAMFAYLEFSYYNQYI